MAQNTVRETCCNHSTPSPAQHCLSTMTEDISKLNKEKHFPQIEKTQLHIIHIAHWTVHKRLCDIINAHSPGSVVMYEECWYESFGAGAAGHDQ